MLGHIKFLLGLQVPVEEQERGREVLVFIIYFRTQVSSSAIP